MSCRRPTSARSCGAPCATKRREADIRGASKFKRAVAAFLVVLLGGAAVAAEPPAGEPAGGSDLAVPAHRAVYDASVRGIPIRLGLRLEPLDGGGWQYRSWAEPRGLLGFINKELKETSVLTVVDDRVVPISYRKRDEFGDRDSAMEFDSEAGVVRIEYRGKTSAVEWEPGIYDLQSLRVALSHDLLRGELGDVYRIVDDRGRVDAVDVTVAGREPLETPLGRLETVRLEYYSERRDRLFRLWIAPDMDGALVALEQYEEDRLRGRLEIVEYQRLETAAP